MSENSGILGMKNERATKQEFDEWSRALFRDILDNHADEFQFLTTEKNQPRFYKKFEATDSPQLRRIYNYLVHKLNWNGDWYKTVKTKHNCPSMKGCTVYTKVSDYDDTIKVYVGKDMTLCSLI